MIAQRNGRRRRRHLLLGLATATAVAALFFTLRLSPELWVDVPRPKAGRWQWRLSVALAYTALAWLSVVLLIGPWRALRGRPGARNIYLRRDIAIWGGLTALGHVAVALFVHARDGRIWKNFFEIWPSAANPLPLKFSKIGLANYLGLLQLSLVLLLLLLSNDLALRRLGAARWKRWQRLNYVAYASILAHAFLYHVVERRLIGQRLVVYIVFAAVLLAQMAGAWAVTVRRRQQAARASERQ